MDSLSKGTNKMNILKLFNEGLIEELSIKRITFEDYDELGGRFWNEKFKYSLVNDEYNLCGTLPTIEECLLTIEDEIKSKRFLERN